MDILEQVDSSRTLTRRTRGRTNDYKFCCSVQGVAIGQTNFILQVVTDKLEQTMLKMRSMRQIGAKENKE